MIYNITWVTLRHFMMWIGKVQSALLLSDRDCLVSDDTRNSIDGVGGINKYIIISIKENNLEIK